ncbi:hypothetical protein [Ancylobacter polymorphus]|uniref:Serine kinase n=1 Tax=Ancylobacter polymorphus TaxID=223390 RepID=A0ABU0BG16_9HYPH|nr:hypothetical protein [Ancylobacter polymorphus]MDQ0304223.1 hypothetical protein [Ancylobacter polymorphus]
MHRLCFALGAESWVVEGSDACLLPPLRALLGGLERDPAAAAPPTWRLELGRPDITGTQGLVLHEGQMETGPPFRLFETTDALVLLCGSELRIEANRADGTGWAMVAPGSERLLMGQAGVFMMSAALDSVGQQLVHAAALVRPGGTGAILLAAPSGAGKTTTALALAQQGFGLMSDDGAVLCPGAGGVGVWGLPRRPKVHRATAALLPSLEPGLGSDWDAAGEQPLDLARLSGLGVAPPGLVLPLEALIWLAGRRAGAARCAPMARDVFLSGFAADNLNRGTTGVPQHHLRRFVAMSRAVGHAPTYELRVGDDLADVGEALRRGLAQA